MPNHWFTSDTHFGHSNIIEYAGRPFHSVQEMDEILIQNWNAHVRPQDHIYHLGDVSMERSSSRKEAFCTLIRRLNGHRRLILGNHDRFPVKVYAEVFEKVMASNVHEGMLFTHIPIHPQSMGRFKANVHGHIHEKPAFPPVSRVSYEDREVEPGLSPYINLSVEATGYRPVELEELRGMVRGLSG